VGCKYSILTLQRARIKLQALAYSVEVGLPGRSLRFSHEAQR
jgi:hypothetical protein